MNFINQIDFMIALLRIWRNLQVLCEQWVFRRLAKSRWTLVKAVLYLQSYKQPSEYLQCDEMLPEPTQSNQYRSCRTAFWANRWSRNLLCHHGWASKLLRPSGCEWQWMGNSCRHTQQIISVSTLLTWRCCFWCCLCRHGWSRFCEFCWGFPMRGRWFMRTGAHLSKHMSMVCQI